MTTRITDTEIASLTAARTEQEWNTACNRIKADRGGAYPVDWWPKVALTGLMRRKQREFEEAGTQSPPPNLPGFAVLEIEAPRADPEMAAHLEADLRRRGL